MQKSKILLIGIALGCMPILPIQACSDVFVNTGSFHVEGRTMDFPINMGTQMGMGFVGQKHTTDIIVDVDKIPLDKRISWQTHYGYVGRTAFNTPNILDGLNSAGFSISILYLPDSQFPRYNAQDNRPAISVYDVGTYLLSQAENVQQALSLLKDLQIVSGALQAQPGNFIKDIPIHYVLRDSTGASAIIEFIGGEVKTYPAAGNVMTNEPSYDWQLDNVKYYNSLLVANTSPNPKFESRVYNYQAIYQSDFRHSESNLLGTPGDFSSPSRFVRAQVMLNNFTAPQTTAQALYQVDRLNESVHTPLFPKATATLWATIKDLDNRVVYYKDYGYYQGDGSFYPLAVTGGYQAIDLKAIHFDVTPEAFAHATIQVTPPSQIKQLQSAADIPVFKGVD